MFRFFCSSQIIENMFSKEIYNRDTFLQLPTVGVSPGEIFVLLFQFFCFIRFNRVFYWETEGRKNIRGKWVCAIEALTSSGQSVRSSACASSWGRLGPTRLNPDGISWRKRQIIFEEMCVCVMYNFSFLLFWLPVSTGTLWRHRKYKNNIQFSLR